MVLEARLFPYPDPSQRLSSHLLLPLSFSPALLALLFLFFFLSFVRLFRCLLRICARAPQSGRVCVCVCHTLFLRVLQRFSQLFMSAGGSRVCSWREPTKLQVQTRISKEDALSTYLRLTFNQAVPILPFLIPWWFTILSLKPSSSSFFQQPRFLQHVIASEPFVKTPSTHRTFHRAVPSPFFLEIELTENQ